jgi:hypothetical protein
MSEHIIQLLVAERDRLERAIEALQGSSPKVVDVYDDPSMPDWVKPKAKTAAPKKRGMSAATRRKMAEGQKKRWAAKRASVVAESVSPERKTNSVRIAEAIAPPPEETDFKKRMSEIMKKAWAKRRKKAAPVAMTPKAAPAKASLPTKKDGLTEAGRKALSVAMKKRWAAKKKATAKDKKG